jgi:ABC-2 type transport system permease protein
MNYKVVSAVFKRNFASYFSSPTGYVFICVFVLLSSFAAFWPNEFFNRNLANLDQLSRVFPLIMLVFIPAVTMAVWSDERRQGTDELLLTLPARDFEIVLGKYLAAVAIYTFALLFSLLCNSVVLGTLGQPDLGLLVGTYVGYWLVGLAMLAIGMVASFLTANLTVAYILGAVFNVPLVFLAFANSFSLSAVANLVGWKSEQLDEASRGLALAIKQWSLPERFTDFGRGILDLSGVVYFGAIVAVMLYLSMVLIGRRQWPRGKALGVHYAIRAAALALGVLGVVALVQNLQVFGARIDARLDVTSEKLSSLSPSTRTLLDSLQPKRAVLIDAFISPEVPEAYVAQRLNLLSMLREIEARCRDKVQVRIHNTERFSEEAELAEKRYDIKPRDVPVQVRGAFREEPLYLGIALSCGLQKVVVPFVERGISPEYELVRSLMTITEEKRKRLGVLQTDAPLFGRFDPSNMSQSGESSLVQELKKEFDVVQVDATGEIKDKYDVLLAVQPSTLSPEQMDHFVAAVRSGQPTAIFEDPFPAYMNVPGTSEERRPPGGMNPMMMQQQPRMPKGDLKALWDLLGIDFSRDEIVWQNYNPHTRLGQLSEKVPELVFVARHPDAGEPFNDDSEVTSKLQEMLFPFPGWLQKRNTSELEFTSLVRTGEKSGYVAFPDLREMSMFGMGGGLNPNRRHNQQNIAYTLAAAIRGKVRVPPPAGDDKAAAAKKPQTSEVNVIVVADVDLLSDLFFRLRERGDASDTGLESFDFDDVTFVLNALDKLAGETRFIEIRKRRPVYRTLTRIDTATNAASKARDRAIKNAQDDYEKTVRDAEKEFNDKIEGLQKDMEKQKLDQVEILNRIGMAKVDGEKRLEVKKEELKRVRDQDLSRVETRLNLEKNRVRDRYKLLAVLLPPILPLMVAVGVFFRRRSQEREGVARNRLRS